MDMVMNVAWMVGLVYTRYQAAEDAADAAIEWQFAMCDRYCTERAYGADCQHQYNVEAIQERFEAAWHTNDAHVVTRWEHERALAEAAREAEALARDQALWDAGEIPF
jgi:hypothetical protein